MVSRAAFGDTFPGSPAQVPANQGDTDARTPNTANKRIQALALVFMMNSGKNDQGIAIVRSMPDCDRCQCSRSRQSGEARLRKRLQSRGSAGAHFCLHSIVWERRG